MGWIQTDAFLGDRFVVFAFTRQDAINIGINDLMEQFARTNDPDIIEIVMREQILKHRPELTDCVIYSMSYNHSHQEWEIGVSHASLPRVGMFAFPERVRLVDHPARPE